MTLAVAPTAPMSAVADWIRDELVVEVLAFFDEVAIAMTRIESAEMDRPEVSRVVVHEARRLAAKASAAKAEFLSLGGI